MSMPRPDARARMTPETSASAAVSPPMKSTIESPKRVGTLSGSPVIER